MPYKDKEKYNEYMRNRRKPDDVNPGNVNPEHKPGVTLLTRPNMMVDGVIVMQDNLYNPDERLYNNPHYPDGSPRYLGPLSDGQVLDRLTV